MPFSPEGSGLFTELLRVVVDDVGVPWCDVLGECALLATNVAFELAADGDDVPDVPSFLLLDLLFESLARESCSD